MEQTNKTAAEIAREIFYLPATNNQAESSITHGAGLIEAYAQQQVALEKEERGYTDEDIKKICINFFFKWYNSPGNNTESGFDRWWELNSEKYKKPVSSGVDMEKVVEVIDKHLRTVGKVRECFTKVIIYKDNPINI